MFCYYIKIGWRDGEDTSNEFNVLQIDLDNRKFDLNARFEKLDVPEKQKFSCCGILSFRCRCIYFFFKRLV